MRAIRKSMRHLKEVREGEHDLLEQLREALVQKYENRTDKKARYRPTNKDKKPLGEPQIRAMTDDEREKLRKTLAALAA